MRSLRVLNIYFERNYQEELLAARNAKNVGSIVEADTMFFDVLVYRESSINSVVPHISDFIGLVNVNHILYAQWCFVYMNLFMKFENAEPIYTRLRFL